MKTMKIQSFSDIITNSSSEIFIFKSNLDFNQMESMFNKHYDSHYVIFPADDNFTCNTCSGMGGEHEIIELDKSEFMENYVLYDFDKDFVKAYANTDEHIYKVHIDQNSYATIDWLMDTFKDSIEMID